MDYNMTNYLRVIELPYAGTVIVQQANGMFETIGDVHFPEIYKVPLPK